MTALPVPRPPRTWRDQAAYLCRRAWWMEICGYQAIYRYVFRRPRVPPGATGFTYHQPVLALLLAFIGVSAVEMVVVDLLVRRWESVRIGLLALSIWGLVWMVGLLFGMLTRPHAVGPQGIRVRSGSEIDIPLDWDAVSAVTRVRRAAQDKQPTVTVDDNGTRTLHLRMQNEANLEIELTRTVAARLPSGTETVARVELYADQPQAFLDAVARHRPR
ncbi:MAG TPA: hypothetical protein VFR07_01500 [Mycobacteriales bacterium]|jgi:hypothetical protein|nr:hypothetical protein [Mycobacteriales bacterium]